MKNFRVQIRYKVYYANFTIMAEDNAESIEQSILDKLGKKEVIFDTDGFTRKDRKWITYEEIVYDTRPIQTKELLGVKLGAGV